MRNRKVLKLFENILLVVVVLEWHRSFLSPQSKFEGKGRDYTHRLLSKVLFLLRKGLTTSCVAGKGSMDLISTAHQVYLAMYAVSNDLLPSHH